MSTNQAQVKFNTNVMSKDCCCYCFHIPTLPLQLGGCGHSFCFTCVKEHKISNPSTFKCPLCRAPITENMNKIKVDDEKVALEMYLAKNVFIYQSKDGTSWWLYEYYMNKRLEELYQQACGTQASGGGTQASGGTQAGSSGPTTVHQFALGVRNYDINFATMEQCDKQTKKYRKVQRLTNFDMSMIQSYRIRGIAGVYLSDPNK